MAVGGREAPDCRVRCHEDELRSLQAELEFHRQTLSQQDEQLRSSSEQIEHLKLVIEKLKRRMFGVKREKMVLLSSNSSHAISKSWSARKPRWKLLLIAYTGCGTEDEIPAQAAARISPRKAVTHGVSGDCCPDCGGQLRQFGEDVSEQLEYIPDSFKVIRHVRPKSPATAATARWKRPRHRVRSNALLPDPDCWPTCWSRSSPVIFRSIASWRSMPAREWQSSAQRWRAGSVEQASCSLRWWTRFRSMCSQGTSLTPTIRRSRWLQRQWQDQDGPPLDVRPATSVAPPTRVADRAAESATGHPFEPHSAPH